jgi:hypothetical protein
MEVTGTAKVEELNESLRYNEYWLNQLRLAYDKGEVTIQQYGAQARKIVAETERINTALAVEEAALKRVEHAATEAATAEVAAANAAANAWQVNTSAVNQAGVALGQMGRRGNAGLAVLEFSRLIEDAQYGVAGVLNNIPTLTMLMGGPAGLAGAVSLVAVGANLLYKHWGDLSALWGEGHTGTEAERMEELGKKTHRTAQETAELNKFKKEQAEIEKLLATPSEAATKAAGRAGEGIKMLGGEGIQAMLESIADKAAGPAMRDAGPGARAAAKAERDEIVTKNLTEAMKGNREAIENLIGLLEKAPAVGMSDAVRARAADLVRRLQGGKDIDAVRGELEEEGAKREQKHREDADETAKKAREKAEKDDARKLEKAKEWIEKKTNETTAGQEGLENEAENRRKALLNGAAQNRAMMERQHRRATDAVKAGNFGAGAIQTDPEIQGMLGEIGRNIPQGIKGVQRDQMALTRLQQMMINDTAEVKALQQSVQARIRALEVQIIRRRRN